MRNEQLKEILESLMRDGHLLPRDVVEFARPEDSPLHQYFEWDDSEAANKWREEQARQLIRTAKITILQPEPVQVRAFVSTPADRDAGFGYVLTRDVLSVPHLRLQLADEMIAKAREWEKRARLFNIELNLVAVNSAAESLKDAA